ncbi:MAG: DUF1573 domain-containing protein [Bacteroidetes bacterium]|nr:DUF1573 domain-containing protein [Bacteroidota bacterium]
MKKILIIISLVISSTLVLNAQEKETDVISASQIEFDKLIYDYGTIIQGANGEAIFTFTNTGKEPLILSRPRSSCGCTVPTWPKEPILPGKSEIIKVTYNTARIGSINKTVTIMSNAENSTVVLRIKGKVVNKLADEAAVKETDSSSENK